MIDEILAGARLAELQGEAARVQRDKQVHRGLSSPAKPARRRARAYRQAAAERFPFALSRWPGV